MPTLGIETSSAHASVAIVDKGELLAEKVFSRSLGHSDQILIAIDALFKKTKVKLGDIKTIGVGIGPGSYTGLRVALATAKGLALYNKIAIVGINSLDSIVQAHFSKWPQDHKEIGVAIDARRGESYFAAYNLKKDHFKRKAKVTLVAEENVTKKVKVLWGPELNKLFPSAKGVAQLAENKNYPDKELKKIEPIYLRPFAYKKAKEHKLTCFTDAGPKSK